MMKPETLSGADMGAAHLLPLEKPDVLVELVRGHVAAEPIG